MEYNIRAVRPEDLEQVTGVEAACFPQAEAADRESFQTRIGAFPDSFFVAEVQGHIAGFINGGVTDSRMICDEMFEDTTLHVQDGAYQAVFGLDVILEYRRAGIAAALMERMIQAARSKGRKGVILTCKEALIPYYSKFGFQNLGLSASVHGGAVWYDMILEF